MTPATPRSFIAFLAGLVLVGLYAHAAAADVATLQASIEQAMESWDLDRAIRTVAEVRSESSEPTQSGACTLLAGANLNVVAMLRVEWENTDEENRSARNALGQRLDAHAEEGLASLADCAESSERWRLEADLLSAMIRSNFRAKKFEKRLKTAIARALELDADNGAAWAASAKPYLFADARHGGDLDEAIRRLEKALALDPGLESARLLLAYALEQQGKTDAADEILRSILAANPACRPARIALTRHHPG